MNYKVFSLVMFFSLMSFTSVETSATHSKVKVLVTKSFEVKAMSLYHTLHSDRFTLPEFKGFAEALKGYFEMKEKGLIQKDILTLIDFSLSSNAKRLWIIDMTTNDIIMNTYVAHGRNTGEEFADSFSNNDASFKSSLGFYVTGEIYNGKHGISLKLDGLEKGINDNARRRCIVMHAAEYVSESFIKSNKRLGRSQGCPAIPAELTNEVIQMIKDKSCLFIYHPSRKYIQKEKVFI